MWQQYPGLVQPADEEVIWKYMPLDRYESFLEEGLYFGSIESLRKVNDKGEGDLTKANESFRTWDSIKDLSDEELLRAKIDKNLDGKSQEDLFLTYKRREKFAWYATIATYKVTLASCWCLRPDEAREMWDCYGREGVAIKSTILRLGESLSSSEDIALSKIDYIDFERMRIDTTEIPYPIYKTPEWAHEREVRIMLRDTLIIGALRRFHRDTEHLTIDADHGGLRSQTAEDIDESAIDSYLRDCLPARFLPFRDGPKGLIDRVVVSPNSSEDVLERVRNLSLPYGISDRVNSSVLKAL